MLKADLIDKYAPEPGEVIRANSLDYFAAQSLSAMYQDLLRCKRRDQSRLLDKGAQATEAYEIALRMLAARDAIHEQKAAMIEKGDSNA